MLGHGDDLANAPREYLAVAGVVMRLLQALTDAEGLNDATCNSRVRCVGVDVAPRTPGDKDRVRVILGREKRPINMLQPDLHIRYNLLALPDLASYGIVIVGPHALFGGREKGFAIGTERNPSVALPLVSFEINGGH